MNFLLVFFIVAIEISLSRADINICPCTLPASSNSDVKRRDTFDCAITEINEQLNVAKSDCNITIVVKNITSTDLLHEESLIPCPQYCKEGGEIVSLPSGFLRFSTLFAFIKERKDFAITCSLTIKSLFQQWQRQENIRFHSVNSHQRKTYLPSWKKFLYQEVLTRKLMECNESYAINRANRIERIYRRPVQAVIVWIGSARNFNIIQSQLLSLQNNSIHHNEAPPQQLQTTHKDISSGVVIPWAATDVLYPCKPGTTKCIGSNKKYQGLLPKSDVNFMPTGWQCAQRRPLRALSHVLAIFDPAVVIVLDDDTFLNYALLQRRWEKVLFSSIYNQPIYIGEAMGKEGELGHISQQGFFVGGSGYIIGKVALNRLVAKEVHTYGFEQLLLNHSVHTHQVNYQESIKADSHRSFKQIQLLSVAKEGIEVAKEKCPASIKKENVTINDHWRFQLGSSCISDASVGDQRSKQMNTIPIGVRLVDFCTNLMANENTCQHSDHSLNRCLVYGAAVNPLPAVCHRENDQQSDVNSIYNQDFIDSTAYSNSTNMNKLIGMCFMTPVCDLNKMITCHRYKASLRNGNEVFPVRSTVGRNSVGHYKRYSSMITRGNSIDTGV